MQRRDQLCPDHIDRISENPMRVLDCKREQCVKRDQRRSAHGRPAVRRLRSALHARQGWPRRGRHRVQARSVPGCGASTTTRTTFECRGARTGVAQNAAGGGGRYDGLIEQLGGPATPGIGFGLGIERIMIACDAEGVFPVPTERLDVFVIDTTGGDGGRDVARDLRGAGFRVDRAFDGRSFKSQMTAALRSRARLGVVIEDPAITVRTLQEKASRSSVDRGTLVDHTTERLSNQ